MENVTSQRRRIAQEPYFYPHATVERMTSLSEHAVCFLVWLYSRALVMDCPDLKLLEKYELSIQSILFSHSHPDHIDMNTASGSCDIPTFMPSITPIILNRLGKDPYTKYTSLKLVDSFETVQIDGIGHVQFLPFSHSDISLHGFYVITEDKKHILCLPDGRIGDRSRETIRYVRNYMRDNSIDRLDHVIFDATRIGRNKPIGYTQQRDRLIRGLNEAVQLMVPSIILVKIGDYRQIEYWLRDSVITKELQSLRIEKIFVKEDLYQVIVELSKHEEIWSNVLERVEILSSPNQLMNNASRNILITDDTYESNRSFPHVLLNATRQSVPLEHPDTTESIVPLGLSGHDNVVTTDITNLPAKVFSLTHPGGTGYKKNLQSIKLKLDRAGDTIQL